MCHFAGRPISGILMWVRIFHFVILASDPSSSKKPMQMKSTMAYKQIIYCSQLIQVSYYAYKT